MKRALLGLAAVGALVALAAPATAATVCLPVEYTDRPIVCVDPASILK